MDFFAIFGPHFLGKCTEKKNFLLHKEFRNISENFAKKQQFKMIENSEPFIK